MWIKAIPRCIIHLPRMAKIEIKIIPDRNIIKYMYNTYSYEIIHSNLNYKHPIAKKWSNHCLYSVCHSIDEYHKHNIQEKYSNVYIVYDSVGKFSKNRQN